MPGGDLATLGGWALAWLLGAIPSGVIVAGLLGGPDPRSSGSGNTGASNLYRLGGRRMGLVTLAADAGKGLLACAVARSALPGTFEVGVAALLVVVGHCWSPFLDLRGGKGVATGLGAWLVLAPLATLAAAGVWAAAVLRWRRASVGALAACAVLPVLVGVPHATRRWLPATVALVVLVLWRHRENIGRLLSGTEPRVGASGAEDEGRGPVEEGPPR